MVSAVNKRKSRSWLYASQVYDERSTSKGEKRAEWQNVHGNSLSSLRGTEAKHQRLRYRPSTIQYTVVTLT